jgi:Tfp pilus assembly protein PilN
VIHTNLSTRPFYNVRAVSALLALLSALVLVVTAYNVVQLVSLTGSQRTLGAKAAASEREAARLHEDAVTTLARVDQKELAIVDKAAREAKSIIDQRVFSWTDLLSHFEQTLPSDVRITSVQQQQAGRQMVVIAAEARNIDDLNTFIEALEKTGTFHDVTPRNEVLMENDIYNATIEAAYTPQPRQEAAQ